MPWQGIAVRNRRDKNKVQARKKIQAFWQHRKLQGALVFHRIDLFVSGDFDIIETAKALAISSIGTPLDGKIREGVIYRLKAPQPPVKYPYLTVSDNVDAHADILTINDFRKVKDRLKKKPRKGAGLEVTIAPARKMDAAGVGRWFGGIKELHSFCHLSGCQFILSSGANSMHEMVSGPCLDAILKSCDIDPQMHWRGMKEWLEARLARRVTV